MAEELGLRERKKRDTMWRIYRTALDLFAERGFDKVSVQEIADASDVSKMTVFNYFGSKEDLVFHPMEEHFRDAARAVRDRLPGESAVDAVRRQFLEMAEARDASIGLHSEPIFLKVRKVVSETSALMERAFLASRRGTREMADLLAEETGDPMLAMVAAVSLTAARNALVEEHYRRLAAGESPEAIAADAVERARHAFGLVENGLKGYAVKA
ncbi:TetR family transcriptional regulator [Streptomyces filipinensis]|uniref:TetR family transcriptional regulator n=1 Tax=Streptomyces filipinensis TaxID=66887 RepID=A0A918ICB4_9ACTN|nr:TetR/AcrR family transcriptional regulator [Streptomyces filipinensis]GGV01170.1 TetR family transcriptional regulator [Streptomyces filipinensis]